MLNDLSKHTKNLKKAQSASQLTQFYTLLKPSHTKSSSSLYQYPKTNQTTPKQTQTNFFHHKQMDKMISNPKTPNVSLHKKMDNSDQAIKILHLSLSKNKTNHILLNLLLSNAKKRKLQKQRQKQQALKNTNLFSFSTHLIKYNSIADTRLNHTHYPLHHNYHYTTLPYKTQHQFPYYNHDSLNSKEISKQISIVQIPLPSYKGKQKINRFTQAKLKLNTNKYLSGFRCTQNLHQSYSKILGGKILKQQKVNVISTLVKKQNRNILHQNKSQVNKMTARQNAVSSKTTGEMNRTKLKNERYSGQNNQYIDPWSTDAMNKDINFFDIHDHHLL